MSNILNINGYPYTTAAQDMRLKELKGKFRESLSVMINEGMKKSRDGVLRLDLPLLEAVIDAAYYMGREDAG